MEEEVAWAAEGYEAGSNRADEEEVEDNEADEEEAVMRRLCATGAAMMHPSKERRSGKYRAPMVASWSA